MFKKRTTVADRLTDAGYDPTTLHARGLGTETIMPATITGEDGSLITGLAYMCDFDATQEWGIGDLRKEITSEDPRRFQMTRRGAKSVGIFADAPAIVLSTRPLRDVLPAWGDDVGGPWSAHARYASFYTERLPWAHDYRSASDLRWKKMDQLRAIAREVGLTPMPRRKDDLIAALGEHPRFAEVYGGPRHPDRWPAYFNGATMVLRADEGPARVIVDALKQAVERGTLGIGNYSGPFSSGMFVYDAADETKAVIAAREARFDWHDARMADLEPVAAELKAKGHGWYFLGKPSEHKGADGEPVVEYWLNGYGSYRTTDGRHVSGQPYGWYSLEELRAEKFVDDLEERQRERAREKARS